MEAVGVSFACLGLKIKKIYLKLQKFTIIYFKRMYVANLHLIEAVAQLRLGEAIISSRHKSFTF